MELVVPSREHLASYSDALRSGWSPNTMRAERAQEDLDDIDKDPDGFLAGMEDRVGGGRRITLPDGSTKPRLPNITRWMWANNAFVGNIGLRWQPGSNELPPTVLGHIGYTVVEHARGRGYATKALHDILPLAPEVGLTWVDLTTDPDNYASQRVITANGGQFIEEFPKPPEYGEGLIMLFRIYLT